jgi:hypothetical protein
MLGPTGSRLAMLNSAGPILEGLRLVIMEGHHLSDVLVAAGGSLVWSPWALAYSAVCALAGVSSRRSCSTALSGCSRNTYSHVKPGIVVDGVWKRFHRESCTTVCATSFLRWPAAGGPRPEGRRAARRFLGVARPEFRSEGGEALGIIGPNGAGKSTLLKVLNRIIQPTRGTVVCQGRIGALIEVAAGFHPDLTGRENVSCRAPSWACARRRYGAIRRYRGIAVSPTSSIRR